VCGIVGYIGKKNVMPVLVNGLQKLEYRGYDSAGVATVLKDTTSKDNKFELYRAEGKLSNLRDKLIAEKRFSTEDADSELKIGIGHTRWATHGRPSETNAHPHIAGIFAWFITGLLRIMLSLEKIF